MENVTNNFYSGNNWRLLVRAFLWGMVFGIGLTVWLQLLIF